MVSELCGIYGRHARLRPESSNCVLLCSVDEVDPVPGSALTSRYNSIALVHYHTRTYTSQQQDNTAYLRLAQPVGSRQTAAGTASKPARSHPSADTALLPADSYQLQGIHTRSCHHPSSPRLLHSSTSFSAFPFRHFLGPCVWCCRRIVLSGRSLDMILPGLSGNWVCPRRRSRRSGIRGWVWM